MKQKPLEAASLFSVLLWLSWIFDRHRIALPRFFLLSGLGVDLPGTIVAFMLDVVLCGDRGEQQERAFAQLLRTAQNDLRASVIVLNRPFNFDLPAFELVDVSHFLEIGGKHNHGERTGFVLAEIEDLSAVAAVFHVQHGSTDTLGRAHVLARLAERDAVMRRSIGARRAHGAQRKKQNG
jgi:hypothetical protein